MRRPVALFRMDPATLSVNVSTEHCPSLSWCTRAYTTCYTLVGTRQMDYANLETRRISDSSINSCNESSLPYLTIYIIPLSHSGTTFLQRPWYFDNKSFYCTLVHFPLAGMLHI